MKIFFLLALAFPFPAFALSVTAFQQRPKLVVLIVVDQFRADYLTRFPGKFIAAGSAKNPGGFRFLMEKGAYYPFAEYDVLQNMTCPGHAMIATGTRPALNGVAMNQWFERSSGKKVYCVADPEFELSPRVLKTTTFGDELKGMEPKAKVVALALKDRASILLGGHRADSTFWFDKKTRQWQTTAYYGDRTLPWLKKLNAKLPGEISEKNTQADLATPTGARILVDAALASFEHWSLGTDAVPDVLAVSFSGHDYAGHEIGPNAPEMETLTLREDQEIARLLRGIARKLGGLDDVVIAFTGDHGVPLAVEKAKEWKLPAGKFDYPAINAKINEALNAKFGAPKSKNWIAYAAELHFYLDRASLDERGVNSAQAEAVAKAVLEAEPGVFGALSKSSFLDGSYRQSPLAPEIAHSYLPAFGDLVLMPRPFYFENEGYPVNHETNWAYDRMVPLVIYGRNVKAGVYSGAKVIDLAPTLSFLLNSLPSATSEGRVLAEILR